MAYIEIIEPNITEEERKEVHKRINRALDLIERNIRTDDNKKPEIKK